MKMDEFRHYPYLDNAILINLSNAGLDTKSFSNTQLFSCYNNRSMSGLTSDQIANLKMFNYDFIILHKSEKTNQSYSTISSLQNLSFGQNWQSEFFVFNVNTNQSTVISLAISSFDCGAKLESCSNIAGFVRQVKSFVQSSTPNTSSDESVTEIKTTTSPSSATTTQNDIKQSAVSNGSAADKFKVVRVKDVNSLSQTPISIEIYDKNKTLKVGDNVLLTRTDEVIIPGTRKKYKSEKSIGKGKIIDDFNKPLYTVRLIGTAIVNFKEYKNGDENYTAVKGEDSKDIVSTPKVMVLPEKIDPKRLLNGDYQLSNEEILIIGAIKNKLENKSYTTIGFESTLKKLNEDRLINENTQVDLKSLILESSGADFYVEFKSIYDPSKVSSRKSLLLEDGSRITQTGALIDGKPKWESQKGRVYKELTKSETLEKVWKELDDVIYLHDQSRNLIFAIHGGGNGKVYQLWLNQNADYTERGYSQLTSVTSPECNQDFNFKIRNYATNEDVATDIKRLNTCGSPEDYKSYAETILNEGALSKMNAHFNDVLTNGKKISVNFSVLNSSSASFEKLYNGIRLEEHIQNAIQSYSLTYGRNGVVNKRMTFSEVYIPSVNENTGLNYYPNDFALSVVKYLKDIVSLDCEKTVVGQNVNIVIK